MMAFFNVISDLNYWAVLVATFSAFVIGGLWYSPVLFDKKWMSLNGFTDETTMEILSTKGMIIFGSFSKHGLWYFSRIDDCCFLD